MFNNNLKREAIERLEEAEKQYKKLAEQVNSQTLELYRLRKSAALAIHRVERYINMLANSPKEFARQVVQVRLDIKEFDEAVRIEGQSVSNNIKGAGAAAAGAAVGGAMAALGPTAAMAIATTFGTASTGTAIATLHGAVATKAALAWLGGGALSAGGGGVVAGKAMLAMMGPVGWCLAGTFVVGGAIYASSKNRKAAEDAQKCALEIEEQIAIIKPNIKKLRHLIKSTMELKRALNISLMVGTYPEDYRHFSDEQKHSLAALINSTKAMGELINKRIE